MKSTRIIRGALYLVKMYFNRKEKTLLITQAADINNIVINNESIYYDSQIGYLLDELKKKTTLLKLQLLNEGVDTKRANMLGKDFVPYEVIIILKKIITKFKIDSNKIEDNIDKLHLLNWKVDGYDLSKIADKYLEDMLRNSIISNVKEEIYAEHFLNKINVTSVIATDEADRPRCFIVAGNKNKLNTYGIQHGIIAPVSRSYMIPSDDNIYVPKITFLWGEKYKNILIDNSKVYTENNLKVVGQLRTDYLIKKTNSEREKIKKDEKIRILYATQYLWDLTYEATNIFIDAIEKLENVEVLIKLHPVDKYEEFYEKLIKERKLKNVKISREIDIYEAILWSDLVVTVHSTVVLEAALLNKPSICILLNKYYDQGGFVKKGISIGVSSAEEFYTVLTEHRYENSNLSQYVEENFYKVDGNVFKRIEENINIK